MTSAELNYLSEDVEPSLFRTGAVKMQRNVDGSDSDVVGVRTRKVRSTLLNGRSIAPRPTCERNGVELVDLGTDSPEIDFYQHEPVVQRWYPACEAIVREATGAGFVAAFDHNVRSAAGKDARRRIVGGQEVQGPALIVHGDYTLVSAPQRVADLARPPSINDTLRDTLGDRALVPSALAEGVASGALRFAIINVWRSVGPEPVVDDAMAFCDGRSVQPEDLVVFEIHYSDRIGENYWARPSSHHRWITYSGMTRGEALLIKQWDSAGTLAQSGGERADGDAEAPCTFSFHTAFRLDEPPPEAPVRESIEVRCLVIWE